MNDTITVLGSVTITKEVPLPYFCRHGDTFYKVENKGKSILVSAYEFSMGIEINNRINDGMIAMSEPCTEDEFLEALYKVSDFIQKQIPCIT